MAAQKISRIFTWGSLVRRWSLDRGGWGSTVRFLDASTGAQQFQAGYPGDRLLPAAISANGDTVIAGLDKGAVYRWLPMDDGKVTELGRHDRDIYAIAYSPGRNLAASVSADNRARIFDVETGQLLQT